ncbi:MULTISPECIES: DUF2273 domain-containing protein [Streptomyces]|uniref:DUF2273 domain-containing protein n=1 Tax=Streptomyces glycanivorans TaxID=3033808 RepID=A0ABY9JJT3_9ACTN|nr:MULTISPECIES: DUF2273 domain-containing protein [unclassified Streptomyces]WSQ81328.1 DUF2273 domain-containing protein [Streptomyces sp. NBC_01213]TXS10846.1 DUF2273 domain-containing protein [Streptomyces sp. wa22]WLQ67983.1 DUF2273 domain-containing protein [Streptomyces sp. Alt3]WSQ88658.1 DUF2273 domain-containing protein [Streptomyces sp. NBC_01212]WSR05335.1 DUF2273 domain-containing protein [Streptomyces sp. NBC_01208]
MSRPVVGTGAGMALAFAAYFGGFGAFLLVASLGAVGAFVGHRLDGGGVPDALRDAFERNRR